MAEDCGDEVAVLAFNSKEVRLGELHDPFKFMLPEFALEGGVKKINVHLRGEWRIGEGSYVSYLFVKLIFYKEWG